MSYDRDIVRAYSKDRRVYRHELVPIENKTSSITMNSLLHEFLHSKFTEKSEISFYLTGFKGLVIFAPPMFSGGQKPPWKQGFGKNKCKAVLLFAGGNVWKRSQEPGAGRKIKVIKQAIKKWSRPVGATLRGCPWVDGSVGAGSSRPGVTKGKFKKTRIGDQATRVLKKG